MSNETFLKNLVKVLSTPSVMEVFRESEDATINPFSNAPMNAMSFDARRIVEVSSGTFDEILMELTPPEGYELIVEGYAVYSDAQFASYTEFIPRLNGSRQFPYHGTPDLNNPYAPFKITMGLDNNLADSSIIPCNMRVSDQEVFSWSLTNQSPVSQVMGVRVKGYVRPVGGQSADYRIGG
jgi:hypothetical protein